MSDRQQELFERDPPPWELDEQDEQLVARVVLAEKPFGPFDYLVPAALSQQVSAGRRLRIPLGNRKRAVLGYCIDVRRGHPPRSRLKQIVSVVDNFDLARPSLLRLAEWISDYYLCPLGKVLDSMIPAGVRSRAGTREQTFLSVPTSVASRLTQLKLPQKQALVLRCVATSVVPLTTQEIVHRLQVTAAPINALRKKGLLREEVRRVETMPMLEEDLPLERGWPLNLTQQTALERILAAIGKAQHETILLHGVTGSGKTEVYIRAIEEIVRQGKQAIVLVPEISLTPQTRHRFRSRFRHVAVLHSHLSDAERSSHWKRIQTGEIQVVVGARSAIFAPTPQLGLIVLDEEHDSSFKQDSLPRYHARDVAAQLARFENLPLVLGSATPALESYAATHRGKATYIRLEHRVNNLPLPHVEAVDLRIERQDRSQRGGISRALHQEIDQTLRDRGQIILLLNRRGYSTHIQCPACGHVVRCPHCDITLTHHRDDGLAVCHYCDYHLVPPTQCSACQFEPIQYGGLGTERLEAEVRAKFPEAQCVRMDSDTMRQRGSHERALHRFRSGDAKILLGTQMIAKGLDFPNVMLVGVINADTSLHLPDFRAAERTFQLVTQVAGRTGRGKTGGRVIVQTLQPEHAAIQAALRHDYLSFARQELLARQEFGYPPFCRMLRIVTRGPSQPATQAFSEALVEQVRARASERELDVRIMGPAPAPLPKLRGKYRFHALLQFQEPTALKTILSKIIDQSSSTGEIQWIVDVDPLDML